MWIFRRKESRDSADSRTRKKKRHSDSCSCRRRRLHHQRKYNQATSTATPTVTSTEEPPEYQFDDWQGPLHLVYRSPMKKRWATTSSAFTCLWFYSFSKSNVYQNFFHRLFSCGIFTYLVNHKLIRFYCSLAINETRSLIIVGLSQADVSACFFVSFLCSIWRSLRNSIQGPLGVPFLNENVQQ